MNRNVLLFLVVLLAAVPAFAQPISVTGVVTQAETGNPIADATVATANGRTYTQTDTRGRYSLLLRPGSYTLVCFALGYSTVEQPLTVVEGQPQTRNVALPELTRTLDEVAVQAAREQTFGITRLKGVDGMAIYEGKKSEVVVLRDITANKATNNARQVFAKVTGLNIWESDGAGLQLGIGGRGLSPNRTSNFNVRQNGYDISADALGYPESYYTPPVEALERIEVVRGAASLQYGTQFGGMLNFRLQRGPTDQKVAVNTRQTVGSWGFLGTFNSVGGTVANGKLTYYTFFQHKQGNGWRPNSQFETSTAYASVQYRPTKRLTLGTDYTYMRYVAQQPGGLTDALFAQNARQSIRERNWFRVNWNLLALTANYALSEGTGSRQTRLDTRLFGLDAGRSALGNLERINVADLGGNRNFIDGRFENWGAETRLLHRYQWGQKPATLLVGGRYYRGTTTARQGDGDAGNGPSFGFLNPAYVEGSDYRFPNHNESLFLENSLHLTPRLSLTPGLRFERIRTYSEGYYRQRVFDFAGNIVADNRIDDAQVRSRQFVLLGLGVSYKPPVESIEPGRWELYANISQNYRAINFSDLRIANPNFVVDPAIRDERGYTADLGVRGSIQGLFTYELTAFYVAYRDRIGLLLRADQPPLFADYRLRTNIADSRNVGLEAFGEVDLLRAFSRTSQSPKAIGASVFVNASVLDARYVNTTDATIRNRQVELVPPLLLRTGFTLRHRQASATLQYAYTAEHFTDATNARRTASAVNGLIPAYQVVDLSVAGQWRWLRLEGTINNLLDARYFTRRADGYPGPGIIPADGRGLYLTVGAQL
jgi:Fe(3+) dicitrate transport protein